MPSISQLGMRARVWPGATLHTLHSPRPSLDTPFWVKATALSLEFLRETASWHTKVPGANPCAKLRCCQLWERPQAMGSWHFLPFSAHLLPNLFPSLHQQCDVVPGTGQGGVLHFPEDRCSDNHIPVYQEPRSHTVISQPCTQNAHLCSPTLHTAPGAQGLT